MVEHVWLASMVDILGQWIILCQPSGRHLTWQGLVSPQPSGWNFIILGAQKAILHDSTHVLRTHLDPDLPGRNKFVQASVVTEAKTKYA